MRLYTNELKSWLFGKAGAKILNQRSGAEAAQPKKVERCRRAQNLGCRRSQKSNFSVHLCIYTHLLLCSFLAFKILEANPVPAHEGAIASHGEATLRQEGNLLEVKTSDRAVLDWSSFSIAPDETTRFIQPSSSSAILNRVLGDFPEVSRIHGLLESNGRVYLYNKGGILLGPQGIIDVGSFIGTTKEIPLNAFLQNEPFVFKENNSGMIEIYGTLRAASGALVLIGSQVIQVTDESKVEGRLAIGEGFDHFVFDPVGENLFYIQPEIPLSDFLEGAPDVSLAIGRASESLNIVSRNGRVSIVATPTSSSFKALPLSVMSPMALGDITISSPLAVNLNGSLSATGSISVTSTGSNIVVANALSFDAVGSIDLNAAGVLTIPTTMSVTSGGASSLTGSGGITLSGAGTTLSAAVASLTFSGVITGAAGFTISASPGSVTLSNAASADFFNFTTEGNVSVQSMTTTPGGSGTGININAGGSFSVGAGASISSSAGIGTSPLTIEASSISIGDTATLEADGPVLLIADGSITAAGASGTIQTLSTQNVTLVSDNSYPSAPLSGNGAITLANGLLLQTNTGLGGGLVLLYSSKLGSSTFPSTINGLAYTPGSQGPTGFIRGTNEFVGYWYGDLIPSTSDFTILYKSAQFEDLTPANLESIRIALVEPVLEQDDNPEDPVNEPAIPKSNAGCVTPVSGVSAI